MVLGVAAGAAALRALGGESPPWSWFPTLLLALCFVLLAVSFAFSVHGLRVLRGPCRDRDRQDGRFAKTALFALVAFYVAVVSLVAAELIVL